MTHNDQDVDAETPGHETCLECGSYLPASYNEFTEFGVCLNDEAFEPFVEELLEGVIPDSCRELVERKKFQGETHTICADFQAVQSFEIGDDTILGQQLRRLAEKGELTPEALEAAVWEERLNHIDWKTQPVDRYSRQLESYIPEERDKAISSLGALISLENPEAFQTLLRFLVNLPPPTTVREVHLKMDILRQISFTNHREAVVPYLIEELGRTTSNNTTRQWIHDILQFLERCPLEVIQDPLDEMLARRQFSFRLRRRILDMIS
jgi:hypothetical protein